MGLNFEKEKKKGLRSSWSQSSIFGFDSLVNSAQTCRIIVFEPFPGHSKSTSGCEKKRQKSAAKWGAESARPLVSGGSVSLHAQDRPAPVAVVITAQGTRLMYEGSLLVAKVRKCFFFKLKADIRLAVLLEKEATERLCCLRWSVTK